MAMISKQRAEEADKDAITLSQHVNGRVDDPANINRVGNDVENLAKIRAKTLELAADVANRQVYLTEADMLADTSQPIKTPARVETGTGAGDYVMTASGWVWSDVQPASSQQVTQLFDDVGQVSAAVNTKAEQAQVNQIVDNGESLVKTVDADGVFLKFSDGKEAARIDPSTGNLETQYPTNDPRLMANVDTRLVDPFEQFANYEAEDSRIVDLIVDSEKNAQFYADFRPGLEGLYFRGERLSNGGGSVGGGHLRGIIPQGQSNNVNQSGVDASTPYGNDYAYPNQILMLGSAANNVWLGAPGSSSSSREIQPSDITGLVRLRSVIASTGSHGAGAAEGWLYAQSTQPNPFSQFAGFVTWNTCEGNQTIENMLQGSTGSFYFQNQVTCCQAAYDAAVARGQTFSVDWTPMAQGEADVSTANLGELHDLLRSQESAAFKAITGQPNDTRMMSWQMSSFRESGGKEGVLSILSYALEQVKYGPLFICAGPTYIFPFCPDFLHQKGIGHVMRGEYERAIANIYENNGGVWRPLHALGWEVTGANEITVQLSEPAVLDEDWLVAPVVNAGIQLAGGSVTAVTVIEDQVIISTNSAASSVTDVRFGMLGQESGTRTQERIPRCTIRSKEAIGRWSSVLGGQLMYKPMCHQTI